MVTDVLWTASQTTIDSAVERLSDPEIGEEAVERYINDEFIEDPQAKRKFHLAGRLRGVEFYDCLFFYLTRFLKGRSGGKIPRRNLSDFLEEYFVRFKEGDKWLYPSA